MIIIVLADTHMPKRAKALPNLLKEYLSKSDLIIHAGDWQTLDLYHELLTYAPVEGVHGNLDSGDIMKLFPIKKILKLRDFRVGVTHGHEGKGSTTERRVLNQFKEEKLDLIIFGHSHIPFIKEKDGTLLFNPGSPIDKRKMECYSFGKIEINKEIHIEHIYF